jgi:Domain of Unknown Function with PDB structure (DUF3857)
MFHPERLCFDGPNLRLIKNPRFIEINMNSVPPVVRVRLATALFLFLFLIAVPFVPAQANDWRPVTPAELQMKNGQVQPDADAEAIFWDTWIDDSSSTLAPQRSSLYSRNYASISSLSCQYYVRIKIFTDRGRETHSTVDIPYLKGTKIKDLAARVIKADGSIVELSQIDVIDRDLVKANGIKLRAKSFAVPNIEPGVILEYKYKETVDDASSWGLRLQFQQDIPVEKMTFHDKTRNGKAPLAQSYNLTDAKFEKENNGYYVVTRTNVPAFHEEPQMPPEDMVRQWMLLTGSSIGLLADDASYIVKDPRNVKAYWGAVGAQYAPYAAFMNKPNGDIKALAQRLTTAAATDDDKLRKLYEYCQTQIHNTSYDSSLTDEQRKKLPRNNSMGDVLKNRSASDRFIDMFFGALANSLGYETRIGLVADRSTIFFDQKMTNESLVHLGLTGVLVGGRWKFFDPGMKSLSFGTLVWNEEDTPVLLVAETTYEWATTTFTPYERSESKRAGKFKLTEDGALEGEVTIELTGQPAVIYRANNYEESPANRESSMIAGIKTHLTTAEISNVTIENVSDASNPLIEHYRIKVPNYAQKTGKRLFVQPSFFEYGVPALFSSSRRKYDIFFHYPWSEHDTIEITLPQGYDLDNADAPPSVADPDSIGLLTFKMNFDKATNKLSYERNFHFGERGNTLFRAEQYPELKHLFDSFQTSDSHTITLKQK